MSQQVLFWILDKVVLAILFGVVANGIKKGEFSKGDTFEIA